MIRLFEMFSGYGGASFALKKANIPFKCVGFSEINEDAIKCYKQNFPDVKNYENCKKIKPNELPDFDLLTAGFPCQDVSVAGKRDLKRGRTILFQEIIRIAENKQPKYMLLENVRGLLTAKLYEENFFDYVIHELERIGYDVLYKIMNSKDYNVPQNRERIWIVCKFGKWKFMNFRFPEKRELKNKIKDILEDNIDDKYILNEKRTKKMLNVLNKTFTRYGDYNALITKDYANCLTTIDVPVLQLDKNKFRYLTPKECFRLMGFLNDEININNISDRKLYRLAGNGWDINLASKIFSINRKKFENVTCGEKCNPKKALKIIKRILNPKKIKYTMIKRE